MANYIIAGHHEWSKSIWENLIGTYDSAWYFCYYDDELEELVKEITPDKIFFVHWSYKVPDEIVNNYECICFHPTPLPFGRGGTPVQNMIELGYAHTTVTAFRMTDEIDAGPIYVQTYRTSLEGTAQEIYERIAEAIIRLIHHIMKHDPKPYPQTGDPTYFKRRTREDSYLKEGYSKQKLYDFIRMLDAKNYPHARVVVHGYCLEFTDAKLENNDLTAKVRIKYVGE